jgi:hypothetical protein
MPLPKLFWPLSVTASNNRINVKVGATTYAATIAVGTYYSAADLRTAVAAALTAVVSNDWSVTATAQGRITVAGTSAFQLLFSSGAHVTTSARFVLGFGAVDTASATTTTSQWQHQNGWYADDPPTSDTRDLDLYERAQAVALGGQVKGLDYAQRFQRMLSFGQVAKHKVWTVDEGARQFEAIQRLWESGWARFRYWPDATIDADYADYAMDLETAKTLPWNRLSPGMPYYSFSLKLWKLPG